MKTIDNFFKPTSKEVAEQIIGRTIENTNGIYVVSATKPYFGESRQTQNRGRLMHGSIMMFNLRGNLHFCISTGESREQDYFLINKLIDSDGEEIQNANAVSRILGLLLSYDGKWFSDYFNLKGNTQPSTFKKQKDNKTCLGLYELI